MLLPTINRARTHQLKFHLTNFLRLFSSSMASYNTARFIFFSMMLVVLFVPHECKSHFFCNLDSELCLIKKIHFILFLQYIFILNLNWIGGGNDKDILGNIGGEKDAHCSLQPNCPTFKQCWCCVDVIASGLCYPDKESCGKFCPPHKYSRKVFAWFPIIVRSICNKLNKFVTNFNKLVKHKIVMMFCVFV